MDSEDHRSMFSVAGNFAILVLSNLIGCSNPVKCSLALEISFGTASEVDPINVPLKRALDVPAI